MLIFRIYCAFNGAYNDAKTLQSFQTNGSTLYRKAFHKFTTDLQTAMNWEIYTKGVSRITENNICFCCSRVVWKSLLVLYAKDVLTDLVTIHHGQPRWQYCTQVSSTLFGEAIARLYLASMSSMSRANIDKEVSIFQSFSTEILHCIS